MQKVFKYSLIGVFLTIFTIIGILLFIKGKEIIYQYQNRPLISELKELSSFALKNNDYLVAILEDGSEISILNLKDYQSISYDFHQNMLYLYLKDINGSINFSLIDLTINNNYQLKELYSLNKTPYENQITNHIQVYNNKIFFLPEFSNTIIYYDITAKAFVDTKVKFNGANLIIEKMRGLLLFEDDNSIYEYNINKKKVNKLFDNAHLVNIFNDKVIYKTERISNSLTTNYYYEYDYGANFARKIAIANPSGSVFKDMETIIPTIDSYIYVLKENLVYQFISNISNEEIYQDSGYIDFIAGVGDYKIMTYNSSKEEIKIINLLNNDYIEVDYIYKNQLYIK